MSEIRPTEAEKKSVYTRCLKAQDIADNTLFVHTLNILTHTKVSVFVAIEFFSQKKFAKDLDVIIKYQYLCGAKRNNTQSFHQA